MSGRAKVLSRVASIVGLAPLFSVALWQQTGSDKWSLVGTASPKRITTYDFEGREPSGSRFVMPSLRRFQSIEHQVAWVGGQLGTLMKSEDGGLSWPAIDVEPIFEITGLWFFNKSSGWLVGYRSEIDATPIIVRTGTGGKSWTTVSLPSRGHPPQTNDVFFEDAKHGWVVGSSETEDSQQGLIWGTVDGGRTWSVRYSGGDTGGPLYRVRFLTTDIGWAVGDDAILKTEDTGKSWHQQYVDEQKSLLFRGLEILDAKALWVYGSDLLHSEDGGRSWTPTRIANASGRIPYLAVCFSDRRTGWAAIETSQTETAVVKTMDGGKSWEPERGAPHAVNTLSFIDGTLFAATRDGHVYRYSIRPGAPHSTVGHE